MDARERLKEELKERKFLQRQLSKNTAKMNIIKKLKTQ